jgi:hypothetical protein
VPIRSNQYFNNPAFAQAAQNLSSLFEPPSGADAAGWATADAKKADAQRLADFYAYQTGPEYDRAKADRMGVGAGVYTPNQSFYSVDQGNLTSRQNNAATNATSRENNRLSELGNLFGSVSQDAVRPAIPAELATQFGAPDALPAIQGNRSPLSETQVNAQRIQSMSPELQDAIAFGSTPVENVVTPEGPRIQTRLDAIGEQPLVKDGGGLAVTLPDGTTVTQGSGKISEAGGKKINYGVTAEKMLPVLDEVGNELTSLAGAASQNVPLLGNYAQSEKYQRARIAGERFTQVILRNESGAATPKDEIANYMATFLPEPGDKPGTIKFKAWVRHVAVQALKGGMSKDERVAAIDAAIASGMPEDFGATVTPPVGAATGAPAAPAPAAGPGRFERGPDGKLIRVQ